MAQEITQVGDLHVGDIIQYDVGYSMVLPRFAIIDSFTPSGKSARCRLIGNKIVSTDQYGQSGMLVPDPEIGRQYKTYRIKKSAYGPDYIEIEGHWSHKWDGNPTMFDHMD